MPYTLGELFTQVMNTKANSSAIPDVQINGSSIINNGVANIPYATSSTAGVLKMGNGFYEYPTGTYSVNLASEAEIKNGNTAVIRANQLHTSVYYGLSKLAGVDLKNEEVTVGTYPQASKTAIQSLIGIGLAGATPGLVKINGYGLTIDSNGVISVVKADSSQIKAGGNSYAPIVPYTQHLAVYYGLSKLAGVDLANEEVTIGTYPTTAKTAIKSMLGVETVTTVSGSTPTITGVANTRYICGEVSTISITPPQSGIIDVRFDSGSTAATLTVPNTVKWPGWFDPTDLDTNCTYEINIMDGIYGSVMVWA